MGARPGSGKEPLIPFNIQKMDFLPRRLSITPYCILCTLKICITLLHIKTLSEALNQILSFDVSSAVDSAYLQVVFVRENIAIKRSAWLPENSIHTRSLTELQMQTIVSFHWQTPSTGTSIIDFYFFEKWITFKFFFLCIKYIKSPETILALGIVWHELLTQTQLKYVSRLISIFRLSTCTYNSLHNMIICIPPLQPRLATYALVKLIDKFCVTSLPECAD